MGPGQVRKEANRAWPGLKLEPGDGDLDLKGEGANFLPDSFFPSSSVGRAGDC